MTERFGNWRDSLRGREKVSLKKYRYVFWPLLACRWIERQLGRVPMLFAQLEGERTRRTRRARRAR